MLGSWTLNPNVKIRRGQNATSPDKMMDAFEPEEWKPRASSDSVRWKGRG